MELFDVKIVNSPQLPSNIVSLVQQAILGAFAGADGGQRARIGAKIFASRYYGPVSLIGPMVQIQSILIGTTTANQLSVAVAIDKVPTLSAANIAVALV